MCECTSKPLIIGVNGDGIPLSWYASSLPPLSLPPLPTQPPPAIEAGVAQDLVDAEEVEEKQQGVEPDGV